MRQLPPDRHIAKKFPQPKLLHQLPGSLAGLRTSDPDALFARLAPGSKEYAPLASAFRDVQMLAGHAAQSTTQRYIEADVQAQRKVVDLI